MSEAARWYVIHTYSGYENGRIKVPVELLIKLADLYGVSLDYLVGRTEKP